ncbi:MAG: T9SS type A sorting domain-containing protein [Bacteroidota bacterium]|jgi:hypothetical protein
MKQLVLFLLLSLSVKLNAQTVLTTYYIIPPVNGCDGVWAIQPASASTYIFTPSGCGQFLGFSANNDTQYIQLCSIPCTVTMTDPSGNIAICSTGTVTDVISEQPGVFTTYPNPVKATEVWTVVLNEPIAEVQTEIISLTGQRVFSDTQQTLNGKVEIDTSQLSAGTYITSITVNGGTPVVQKLVVL